MTVELTQAQRTKRAASLLSLASNATLTVLKILVGVATGSVSILADAAHSASDLVASGLTFYSVRQADRLPDESHPYGHGKAENLTALAEAVLLFGVAAYIITESAHKLLAHARPASLGWGMAVMAGAAIVNIFVVRLVLRAGRQTGSQSLLAVAEDHRADILTASGVLVGLALVRVTGRGFFDPLLAVLVSLVILRTAWHLMRGALAPLMDSQLSSEDVATVRQVLDDDPSVLSYHKLRTRQSGAARFVDAHVLMDDNLTLGAAHELTEQIEDRIRAALPYTEVTLHSEPFHAEQRHQAKVHGGAPSKT